MAAGELLFRSFQAQDLTLTDDGRTVEAMIVPYGMVAEIWNGAEDRYLETFDHGAFSRAVKAPNRVKLSIDHPGLDLIGLGREMEERDNGLFGRFRLLAAKAEYAKELIQECYSGLSVGFLPLLNGTKVRNGVKHRTQVHLDHVACVMSGTEAYSGSRVLAMRNQGGLLEPRSGALQLEEDEVSTPTLDGLSEALEASRAAYEARMARAQAVLGRA